MYPGLTRHLATQEIQQVRISHSHTQKVEANLHPAASAWRVKAFPTQSTSPSRRAALAESLEEPKLKLESNTFSFEGQLKEHGRSSHRSDSPS